MRLEKMLTCDNELGIRRCCLLICQHSSRRAERTHDTLSMEGRTPTEI
jgi:hypothetical protein